MRRTQSRSRPDGGLAGGDARCGNRANRCGGKAPYRMWQGVGRSVGQT